MVDPSSGKSDAPRLRQRLRVALPIAMILALRPNITLMILGGRYARLFTMQASAYTGEPVELAELDPDGEGPPAPRPVPFGRG